MAGQAGPGRRRRRRPGPPGERRRAGGERGRGRGRSLRLAAVPLAVTAAPQRGRAGSPWGARAAPASPRGRRRGERVGGLVAPSPLPLGAGMGPRTGLRCQQRSCARGGGGRVCGSVGDGPAAGVWGLGCSLEGDIPNERMAGLRGGGEI